MSEPDDSERATPPRRGRRVRTPGARPVILPIVLLIAAILLMVAIWRIARGAE